MKKTMLVLVVVLVAVAEIALAQSCPMCGGKGKGMMMKGGGMGGMHGGGMLSMYIGRVLSMKQDLKLTDDQVNKLEKLRSDTMKETIRISADEKSVGVDLMDNLHKANPDFTAAKANLKKMSDLEAQEKQNALSAYEKAQGILTADQRAKFFASMQQGMGMHRGMGGGMGGGMDMDSDEDEDEGME